MPFAIRGLRRLAALSLLCLAVACGREQQTETTAPEQPDRLTLAAVGFDALPGWGADDPRKALGAFLRSCSRMAGLPADRAMGDLREFGSAGRWQAICREAAAAKPADAAAARRFFEDRFRPWRAANGDEAEGLFTGYYEPELRGSRTRQGPYTIPLMKRPPDLVTVDLGAFRDSLKGERIAGRIVDGALRPYADRAAIETGALDGRGLELLWVDDPVAAFFLHIQGSGRVVLPDGGAVRVGYAAQNGHRYFAVGRDLIERGAVAKEDMSLQAIRDWMRANPDEAPALMRRNPSYVFFRELSGEGPIGAQGAPLTPGRSLAVDPRFVPYGVPVWLDADHPLTDDRPIRRLLVAQDTGGAIRGPVRGDLFWGAGAEAEAAAGRMKSRGGYYLLLPK
ncbi:membrane-bound lytic murein transglycosylase A [Constrictibacter sp. MBR-5]|jgi:membrane-bound lytic murein transglycosylase A|uniref:murein transglycosylase A n=1 Tax=Constrictibacter sp. MBR-5 TaxID=3156467 RepID=UPI003393ECBC